MIPTERSPSIPRTQPNGSSLPHLAIPDEFRTSSSPSSPNMARPEHRPPSVDQRAALEGRLREAGASLVRRAYRGSPTSLLGDRTLRHRRWIKLGVMERLRHIDAYDRLSVWTLGGCGGLRITKAPCGGRRPAGARWIGANGDQALDSGGRQGHPASVRERPRKPPRLAARPHLDGGVRDAGNLPGGDERPPRPRI